MMARRLGVREVSELGLGCMGLSHAYATPPSSAEAERLLRTALELGVTLFDTAALYGFGENETLVGRALRAERGRVVLATKGGMAGIAGPEGKRRVIDGRPEAIRKHCEESLMRLGVEVIDLYYLHRLDLGQRVPVEESVGEMSRLQGEGKIRMLGLSEVSAATLRHAHAVHPIAALQSEYSLWTRNPELGTFDTCRDLGVAFVAFSPLGRGFLGGELRDVNALVEKDLRRQMPRFAPDTYPKNLDLLAVPAAIAREVGCTLAQVALSWLLGRGEHVIPIFGTTSLAHLREDLGATAVCLTRDQVERLDAAINERTVLGARYSATTRTEIDTEDFS